MTKRITMPHQRRTHHLSLTVLLSLLLCLPLQSLWAKSFDGDISDIEPTKEQSRAAVELIRKLDRRHYISLRINDSLSSRTLDSYLSRLDGNKSFFLQSDIDEFEAFRMTLDDTLKRGDLTPGYTMFNRYQRRLVDRFQSIVDTLPEQVAKMDFSKDEEIAISRKDAAWPKTQAEADDIWRKRIKSQVIGLRIAKKPEEEIVPLLSKRYKNQLNRVKQSQSEDAFQIYMNSVASLYDPHTNYLSPATSENFNINMSLSLQGIGAVLQSEDEYTKVVRLVHAGPADKQGELQPSDRIVAVAQGDNDFEDVIGLRLDEVVKLIRGEKGTVVRLEVIPVSAKTDDEHRVIEIVRDTVKLEEQSAQKKVLEVMHNDQLSKLGIIDIPAFYIDFDAWRRGDPNYRSTTRDVKKLLAELIEEGVDGIIIDLRDNGGGSLQEADQLTGLFIDSGPTVQIRHANRQKQPYGKKPGASYYDGPLAVLINRLSASASEIFAGAIQDYQRGIVVGGQSFGKGTVQSLSPLQHGQLKITESKFYRISGESTQHRGVIPDIAFPAIYDHEKVGESSLDNALAWDRINPIRHAVYHNIPAILPELRAKHEQRIETDPDFIYLNDQLALMAETRAVTSLPLAEEKRRAFQKNEKQRALDIENKRRLAKGLEPLDSFDGEEPGDLAASDKTESSGESKEDSAAAEALGRSGEDEEELIDPLLTETGYILMDAVSVLYKDSADKANKVAVSNP